MAYPRQLRLSEQVETDLIAALDRWILDHRSERTDWEAQLEAWQFDYNADASEESKDFPFKDACKIIIPLTAIAVETNHAALMGTIFGSEQLISVRGTIPETQSAAPTFQRFANDQVLRHMDARRSLESSYLELEKFGTGVARTKYCQVTRFGVREVDGVEVEFPVIVKNNVEISSVPLAKFWQSFHELDTQLASWCGELHNMTPLEVKNASRSGLFYEEAYEDLEGRFTTVSDDTDNRFESNAEDLEKREPVFPNSLKIFEIWCSFDVDESDVEKEIQVFYCEDARKIVGCFYNQTPNLRRPYRHGNYIRVEHRWAGIGICKQNEPFQIEITVQHRQRIDNATLANIRMFKVAKMSGYGPNEPIFPGKMWFLDDMNDIEPMQLGEIYPSAYNNENQTILYQQQRVGVNEGTMGMPQVGTPGTATADIARLQEAKRRFDYVINNVKAFTLDVVYDALDLVKQYNTRTSYINFNPRENAVISSILSAPFESFRDGEFFELSIVGDQSNKVLDRQNWAQISQFLTQYYGQMMQLAMNSGNQQLMAALMQKALVGGTEAMRQILETFDIQNIERIIPVQELLDGASSPAIGSGSGGIAGNIPSGGMGSPNGLPAGTPY